jgi:hypothetical protein
VQKVLDMARSAEAEMTKTKQELRKLRDVERVGATQQVAQAQAQPGAPGADAAAPAEELSPVGQVQQQYEAAFANLAALHGAQSPQELAQLAPQVYARLQAAYDESYREALGKEAAFHAQKFTKQQEVEQAKRKLESEYEQVKSTYRANIAKAREKSPDIEQKLISSGVADLFVTLGKLTKIPHEYLLSDPAFFARAAEMAEAVTMVKNMPKLRESMKAEWVKEQAAKASAELPAAGGAPDSRFAMGAALQRSGKGVSVIHS